MDRNGKHDRIASFPASEVWFELRKLLSSGPFKRCPKLRNLLCFIVEEAIAGRGKRLTEYVVGVKVFGLHANYDPRLDSRVRVEVHRLRAALATYYDDGCRGDPVIIRLDKGSYSPIFQYRNTHANGLMDSSEEGVL